MKTRQLPIGNDDFRKLRENGAYYVDKTLLIRDFIEMQDEVGVFFSNFYGNAMKGIPVWGRLCGNERTA